ncbi:uncharacterized protein LAESUDRAFT_761908 [Laetiporus sulphureus 93-53]|uniref:Chromatin modification-related protein n=1 Tax=Laetiporus sulphureus 93-53 TaxID=1314785 RepID=A0A165CWE1_9APHY|nr:uncharacterized protein LAESUDRAFT_761908 [Laetiporus sulphureus 93-53]KZT03574.1 hypothetical protein LAESUDRAFT_761908 [Laetiporus sulphureus 93-53]
MSCTRARKRRRTEALQESTNENVDPSYVAEKMSPKDDIPEMPLEEVVETAPAVEATVDEPAQPQERSAKEQEIWDAFKEEHYEVLEQLPLSLHRSFALILELDQQVHNHQEELLPTLLQYISVRKSLETGQTKGELPQQVSNGDSTQNPPPEGPTPTAAEHDKPVVSSRQLLMKAAQLSEEIVRASNEKVHVARFTYDLVDRYIRDLDRAIKEQETSISLGLRPGTYPASIALPDSMLPPSVSESLALQLPQPEPATAMKADLLAPQAAPVEPQEPTVEVQREKSPVPVQLAALGRLRRRKGNGWGSSKKRKHTATSVELGIKTDAAAVAAPTGLKLVLPPLGTSQLAMNASDLPIDPNEPRYCFCNQVSYGEMVACDREGCEREWFHLGCVDLKEAPPKDKEWFCRVCEPIVKAEREGKKLGKGKERGKKVH